MEVAAAAAGAEQLRDIARQLREGTIPGRRLRREPVRFRTATEVVDAVRERVISKEEARKALGYSARPRPVRPLAGAAAASVVRKRESRKG